MVLMTKQSHNIQHTIQRRTINTRQQEHPQLIKIINNVVLPTNYSHKIQRKTINTRQLEQTQIIKISLPLRTIKSPNFSILAPKTTFHIFVQDICVSRQPDTKLGKNSMKVVFVFVIFSLLFFLSQSLLECVLTLCQ